MRGNNTENKKIIIKESNVERVKNRIGANVVVVIEEKKLNKAENN